MHVCMHVCIIYMYVVVFMCDRQQKYVSHTLNENAVSRTKA
jgi:hypothetical protein